MKHALLSGLYLMLTAGIIHAQPDPADCTNAYLLCNKDAVAITAMPGPGNDIAETAASGCQEQSFPETNSVWFKWRIESGGTLGFTIMPLDEADDFDFVLYRLMDNPGDCASKLALRCMRAGQILGDDLAKDTNCMGATGIRPGESAVSNDKGCAGDASNFLTPLFAGAGESYALFINNYRSTNGFLLEFSGDCSFRQLAGPCFGSTSPALDNFGISGLSVSAINPNPSVHQAQLTVQSSSLCNGTLWLTDIGGRILETRAVSISPGDNILDIPVAQLHTGVYFVKIRVGDKVFLSRFYKS